MKLVITLDADQLDEIAKNPKLTAQFMAQAQAVIQKAAGSDMFNSALPLQKDDGSYMNVGMAGYDESSDKKANTVITHNGSTLSV